MKKKLTDEEIIDGLECCGNSRCEQRCFGYEMDGISRCINILIKNALNLIHRLQEEKQLAYDTVNGYSLTDIEQKAEIERLTDELKFLDWYKMWHGKFKKEIDDLTRELETYRPTKLHGNGQCMCSNCECASWTDFGFSRYKGQTLCNKCLKEIMSKEENQVNEQVVKDTAKEIATWLPTTQTDDKNELSKIIKECYGIEVE